MIVYRSSPAQKAETVKFIRKNTDATTMAIGDGANDVNMIQSAHIGVGIMGKEGNQAASFGDYALPKFKDLWPLLFWHGRSFRVKATNFTCWFVYKGMLFSIPLVPFNMMAGFSGISFVEDFYYALYEVILTTFAIFCYLFFEVDVDHKFKSMDKAGDYLARRYQHARTGDVSNLGAKFAIWSLYAWYSGIVFFYLSFYSYNISPINQDGQIEGISASGLASLTSLLAVHHLIIFIMTRAWNVWIFIGYIFSMLCFMPLCVWLNDSTEGTYAYMNTFSDILPQFKFWLIVLCATTAVMMPYYLLK